MFSLSLSVMVTLACTTAFTYPDNTTVVETGFYGDALECGRHGFSVRDGGFRFEVQGSGPDGAPAHPQAAHPIVIEDPVNVMNNGTMAHCLL